MPDLLRLDIETRSRVDLRKTSVYRYVECPDFDILMCAWALDDDPVRVATSRRDIETIPGLFDPSLLKVAHNAAFERICFSRWSGLPTGSYLDPEPWHDTTAIGTEYGYPAGLDPLAKALGGAPKDAAGTALINFFCKPNRAGEFNRPEDHPEKWLAFMDYCRQDVETLRDVDLLLPDWPNDTERAIYLADQRINDNGMLIDVEMAVAAEDAAGDNRLAQEIEVMSLTGVANPGSVQQMRAWAASVGLEVPNLRAETVEELLANDDLDPTHRRVFELRQELALAASNKYAAANYSVCEDNRVRGAFRFFGAHTGRWSGRGLQPQNLPRAAFTKVNPLTGKEEFDETAQMATIFDLLVGDGASSEDLKKLVRALFVGPYTIVDYAAIEARVIAWLAGEAWALQAFRAGRDIYVETANRMGGLTRAQGKVAVLALGYNGGINSLRAMGAEGEDKELQMLVDQWRKANGKVVRLWGDLQDAFADGGRAGPRLRVVKRKGGRDRELILPSGRGIHYHDVKWEKFRVVDPKTQKVKVKEGFRYSDPKSAGRIPTYGGRLAENATQAVARDLMAEALVRLTDDGYRIAAHIHDEIVVEGTYPVDQISEIMCASPAWADGLPVDGDGGNSDRYRKF